MAASDKPFNDQRKLDIVFAVSNILMLLSVVWMFAQDYSREYKTEQRLFREVEVALAQRLALGSLPSEKEFDDALAEVEKWRKYRSENSEALSKAEAALISLRPSKERAEAAFQAVKADVESITSLRNIALEHQDTKLAARYDEQLVKLNAKMADAQAKRDDVVNQMKVERLKIDEIEGKLTKAVAEFKKVNDKFDAQVKLALNKRWTIWDSIRMIPVLDGFAPPLKIHQFTINDIPIDYNFKQVTRFDRCMSCHVGIDRPAFTRANLEALTKEPTSGDALDKAKALHKRRLEVLDPKDRAAIPDPGDIRLIPISDKVLTPSRVTEFCAHPRLDLFVGSNSKHPAEKFGCTSCHSGQGSGTSFTDASHSPNTHEARKEWTAKKGWEFNHMWDFQMHATRFVEASCLKCHHEVTDLVSRDNRVEAPKVFRGFNLIKENGCFGCHEISGWKGGQRVGPDLRVEPNPPLDDEALVHPLERDRAEKDTDNRPGTLRKVGPSLARVSEKVSAEWIAKWLASPSAFRPDTKMPHYYGLSTNSEAYLRQEHKMLVEAAKAAGKDADIVSQEKFPATEMVSIAHFLTVTSKNYLADAAKHHKDDANTRKKDADRLLELINKGRLEETDKVKEQTEFAAIKQRLRLRKEVPLVDLTPDYDPKVDLARLAELTKDKMGEADKKEIDKLQDRLKRHADKKLTKYEPDQARGRQLFTERGCLACHTHQGTETKSASLPEITSEALFGPNLSQVAEKFADKAQGRKWLIQWIMNPHVHSPRSRMPVTHLTPAEAADIAAWLLEQPYAREADDPWNKIKLEQPKREDLENLARVYLVRMLSKSDMDKFLKGELTKTEWEVVEKDVTKDEQVLKDKIKDNDELKFYLGKKAVTRLGCFGCHDVPGFESVKSIGVGLNDWGKKPADRLAFEDIDNFFKAHYYTKYEDANGKEKLIDSLIGPDGKPFGVKDGKEPYEAFFAEALTGHHRQREGYLNQKIRDPRSYDFNRIRTWDDRSRMPQFQFARPRKKLDEKAEDFKARTLKDEAEAREAVATFVLGLTADQVPTKSINQPTGDRLAEVKGRQVLDKYNCAGCHLIRPGVYDFKLGPKSLEMLEEKHAGVTAAMQADGQLSFANHHNWVGRNPLGTDRLTVYGLAPTLDPDEPTLALRLSEALRFVDKSKSIKNIPASTRIFLSREDLPAEVGAVKTQADLDQNRFFAASAPYGGGFADLMAVWLNKKNPKVYPAAGNYSEARASLPPSLIGQGERTQPGWLHRFLLDPQPIRRMTILRMPKFNMSKDEAEILVEYFAAVTRQNNPGIGLPRNHEVMAARTELAGDYWSRKTAEYIANLKNSPELDKEGKPAPKGRTQYQARIDALTPLWKEIRDKQEPELEKSVQKWTDALKSESDKREAKDKAVKAEKDPEKKKKLSEELEALDIGVRSAAAEKEQAEKALAGLKVEAQQRLWETEQAYAADAFRLLTSRELCTKCHQVGSVPAAVPGTQGPLLDLASDRLRPDWIDRWLNDPKRYLHYDSVMPSYFSVKKVQYQHLHAGSAEEQMHALRDALLNHPRISSIQINRHYSPLRPAPK